MGDTADDLFDTADDRDGSVGKHVDKVKDAHVVDNDVTNEDDDDDDEDRAGNDGAETDQEVNRYTCRQICL